MTMSKPKYSETENPVRSTEPVRAIRSTIFCALRLELLSVEVIASSTCERICFQGVIEFPCKESRAGVAGLYQATDVTGQLTPAVWQQLRHFQSRLSSHNHDDSGRVEIVANRAYLRQPRAWVSKTKLGIAAAAILEIDIDELDRARIPGHRWRVFNKSLSTSDAISVKDEPIPVTTSISTDSHSPTLH